MAPKRKKPMTAADRQAKRRAMLKSNPDAYEVYLRNERERWRKRTEEGKIKTTKDMTARELRNKRKGWRLSKKKAYYLKKQNEVNAQNEASVMDFTPPSSPPILLQQPQSHKKAMGRKKVKQNRSKVYREKEKFKLMYENEKKKTAKYKKRLYRERKKESMKLGPCQVDNSPRKQTNQLLHGSKVSTNVKKTLLFHNVLIKELRSKVMANAKSRKEKQVIHKVLRGELVKKYRMKSSCKMQLGLSNKSISHSQSTSFLTFDRKKRNAAISDQLKELVKTFCERDDNTRMAASKKETITRGKEKKQKRFLLDSMKNLHVKFCAENAYINMSYTTFLRFKPFWIVSPSIKDRETCLCTLHENIALKAEKLSQLKLIPREFTVDRYVKMIVCEKEPTKDCYYRNCKNCKDKKIPTTAEAEQKNWDVGWWKWEKVKEKNPTTEKEFQKTKKVQVVGTVVYLLTSFLDDIEKNLSPHVYRIIHQYKSLKSLKENLTNSEAILHMDFAENYACKYSAEVQSFHFGGSRAQVSLHDVVMYVGHAKPQSLCTVSESRSHKASAIWAYLEPVLVDLKDNHPQVSIIHFFTDGPSSQYRNKTFFFLFSTLVHEYGFKLGTHNFFESGHGKGAADGVGGTLKRLADDIVCKGKDISSAELFHAEVSKATTIKLFYVCDEDVSRAALKLDHVILSPVPGSMQLHQIRTGQIGVISKRKLSCFCSEDRMCNCYSPQEFSFPLPNTPVDLLAEKQVLNSDDVVPLLHMIDTDLIEGTIKPDKSLIGAWCTVYYRYEKPRKIYLGQITHVRSHEIKVKVTYPVGENKFVWKSNELDEVWYRNEDVLLVMMFVEPEMISSRCMRISQVMWAKTKIRYTEVNAQLYECD